MFRNHRMGVATKLKQNMTRGASYTDHELRSWNATSWRSHSKTGGGANEKRGVSMNVQD